MTQVTPLSQRFLLVNETQLVGLLARQSLPLVNKRNGNRFKDRFDPNLSWYLPFFKLVDDPDAAFAFEASQTGTVPDTHGNPFNTCHLTLGLKKVIPDDIIAWIADNPSVQLREIPLTDFSISLGVMAKDPNTGVDRPIVWICSVVPSSDSTLLLSIDNILGERVIVAYENLVNGETATLSISAAYDVWQEMVPSPHHFGVFTGAQLQVVSNRSTAIANIMERHNLTVDRFANLERSVDVASALLNRTSSIHVAPSELQPGPPAPFERASLPFALQVPVSRKFAGDSYRLKFTVADGGVPRPIVSGADLQSYNVRQSEFIELRLLGNVSARYSSIDRLYLGVRSRTIVVIPFRYVILRQSSGCAAVCNALLDSSAGLNAGCKFQFEFILVPDLSPIDLLQLSQEIKDHPDTKDCILTLPDSIKDNSTSTLTTPFATSFRYSKGSGEQNSFLLSVEIKETAAGSPAVANANMLIYQLCSVLEPFLSGALDIKLDDDFASPVDIPVLLNFKETSGTSGVFFLVDEPSNMVNLTNASSFDLSLSRAALVTPHSVTLNEIGRTLPSGQTISLSLPLDHADLDVLVDSDLSIAETISKADLFKYLRFESVDVQNTQYTLGVNGTIINFVAHDISRIDVQINLTDLPEVAIPLLTLLAQRKFDSTHTLIPLDHAMGVLNGTLLCTIHFNDPTKASTTVHATNDFVHSPIFVLQNLT